MTPFFLQNELRDAVEECLRDLRFYDYQKNLKPINVYKQGIPIKQNDDESEPFPYVEVRLVDGKTGGIVEESIVSAWIIIGIYNDNPDNYGTDNVLGVMQRIIERFCKNNTLPHFRLKGEIEWALQNTDTYPYYFGGMEMDFVETTIRHQNYEEEKYT